VALGKLPRGLRTEGKNMKKKAAIIDVDLTLVTDTPFDMERCQSFEYLKEWHRETLRAEKLEVGVGLVKFLHGAGFKLVIMTARDVTGREELMMKLRELGIARLFDKVLMRESVDNGKPSDYVKGKMIDAVEHEYDFKFALDDANHGLYVSRGIKVFNANNWNGKEMK
jgi:FMN phosphatase YigB (HAD superfamily)